MTSLHMAATHNHVEIARLLIDSGAQLRCKDNEDLTPLHCAGSEGNIEIVQLMFQAGAKQDGWVTISNVSIVVQLAPLSVSSLITYLHSHLSPLSLISLITYLPCQLSSSLVIFLITSLPHHLPPLSLISMDMSKWFRCLNHLFSK